jgi:hypothetical protein
LPNTPEKLAGYYEKAESFIAANGTIPLIHLFLGIVFIAVLVAVLRAAMGPEPAVYMAVIGGAVFIALTAAGLATEVAIPAVIARFGDVIEVGVVRPFLALSVWLYHYSQIGSAIVMFATSYAIWRTQVLPKWTAAAGVLGILALAHTWLGLPAAYGTVAWMALMGLVLLAFPPSVQAKEAAVKRPAKTSEPKKVAASPVAMLASEDGADVVPPAADAAAVPTVEDPVVIAAAETVDAKLPTESTDADDEGSNK